MVFGRAAVLVPPRTFEARASTKRWRGGGRRGPPRTCTFEARASTRGCSGHGLFIHILNACLAALGGLGFLQRHDGGLVFNCEIVCVCRQSLKHAQELGILPGQVPHELQVGRPSLVGGQFEELLDLSLPQLTALHPVDSCWPPRTPGSAAADSRP